jgi:ribose transport system permease protein
MTAMNPETESPLGGAAEAAVASAAATPPAVRRRQIPELAGLLVVLVGLFVFFALSSQYFLNWDNMLNILTAVAITGIIAAPGTLLLIGGQFDLSVGSGLGICGVVMATAAEAHGIGYGIAMAVLVGLAIGAINGFLVTVVGVNALITTLGMLAVLRGADQLIAGGQTVSLNGFSGIGTARPFLSIPVPVLILVAVIAAFWFILRFTVFGRSIYAIGANPVAARLAGIRGGRLIFIGFILSGLCVALSGLIQVSQLSAASPIAGTGLELSVITAIVLGGASLAGGRGTLLGTVIGLLIIGILNNGLVLKNVDSFWQDVARGVLLILAVSFDQLRLRFSRREG